MIQNIETGACYGRSFNSGVANMGFCENFYNWITRAPQAVPVLKVSGGPGWTIIDDQSAAVPNPYIVISNHSAANIAANPNRYDEPHYVLRIGYLGATGSEVKIEAWYTWDAAAHDGCGPYANHNVGTYDAADFVYDFRGGNEHLIIQTRRGTTWDSTMIIPWEGDANLVEGTHVIGTLQAGITAGANVWIQLGAGEAANFTDGYWYYLIDANWTFATQHYWVNYVQILDIDVYNDQIQIGVCNHNYPAGAIIGAYPHRFAFSGSVHGTGNMNWFNGYSYNRCIIPYCSYYGHEQYWTQGAFVFYGAAQLDSMDQILGYMSPDDNNRYACQRPTIGERTRPDDYDSNGMNRFYGPLKEIFLTDDSPGIAAAQDGRTINGLNYLYFQDGGSMAYMANGKPMLFPDYNSLT